jgi:hypothetical protein
LNYCHGLAGWMHMARQSPKAFRRFNSGWVHDSFPVANPGKRINETPRNLTTP